MYNLVVKKMHQKQEMLFRNHKMEQIYKANTLFKDKKIVSSALKKNKMEDLRYPIGNFEFKPFSNDIKNEWLIEMKNLSNNVALATKSLNKTQLDTPYREGGWSVLQVVHHLADSHMNAFVVFKLALTEDLPTIKDYSEHDWSFTADVLQTPIHVSITLLDTLHQRWTSLLSSLTDAQWQRKFFHPTHNIEISLWDFFAIYTWHGKHHIAHIENLKKREGWQGE
jgi:hypothetical protein